MELSMRNILARHSARAIALAIVVAMPFAAAAADLFWYGTAGDGLWNNPANWSTTEGSYTAATSYPLFRQRSVSSRRALTTHHPLSTVLPRPAIR